MKRTLAILLTIALLLPLVACGGGGSLVQEEETETLIRTTTEKETEAVSGKHNVTGFCVGFGRADITPDGSVPLSGYGNVTQRMSTNVLDPLYATCIALQDEAGERLLIYQLDIINTGSSLTEPARRVIESATGIPGDHVLFNATHTHSGPAYSTTDDAGIGRWLTKALKAFAQAAKDAVADLDACTGIYVGATETERLNFVRRYYTEDGFTTDNVTYGTGAITGHETPVDEEMRLVKFTRENQPDVVIANWQAHNHRTGGSAKTDISSDFVGIFQKETEKTLGVKMLYLQGGAGNINPTSRITGEALYTNYKDIGKALAKHLTEGLKDMKEVQPGAIRASSMTFDAVVDHTQDGRLEDAMRVKAVYDQDKRTEAMALAKQLGFGGYFEATALVGNAKKGVSEEVSLECYAFGDVGLAAAPFEMFCQTYQDLRAKSPFAFTLTCGYSNTSHGYMPAAECFANKGYEVAQCHYVEGTAEIIENYQLDMLNELKTK